MPDAIHLEDIQCSSIASVAARKGHDAGSVGELLGGKLPEGPSFLSLCGTTFIGNGPTSWLAISENGESDFSEMLASKLTGRASISDQTGAYCIMRIAGSGARRLLQSGAAIDLHSSVFRPGSAATTAIGHIGVVMWQLDEQPSYHLAVFRTFVSDFRYWLQQAQAGR